MKMLNENKKITPQTLSISGCSTGGCGCRGRFLVYDASAVAPSLLSGWCTLFYMLRPLCTQVDRPGALSVKH